MGSLNPLQNLCVYSLGDTLSNNVQDSLKSQITGIKDMAQIEQAIYIETNGRIAKTEGAIQNIDLSSQFVGTTLNALKTVEGQLTNASKSIMTLLNDTVSASNKEAAVDAILSTTGMVAGPTSRDQQEGSVVKTLRQTGSGMAPFYSLTTTEGGPATPTSAPPPAVEMQRSSGASSASSSAGGSESLAFTLTGSGNSKTFDTATTACFENVPAGEVRVTHAAVGTANDGSDAVIVVTVGDKTYQPDAATGTVDLTGGGTVPADIVLTEDGLPEADAPSKITLTVSTAPASPAIDSDAQLQADVAAALNGTLGASSGAQLELSGQTLATSTMFLDATTANFENVAPGSITVDTASIGAAGANGMVIVKVGGVDYMPAAGSTLDVSAEGNTVKLIKEGQDPSSSITLTTGDASGSGSWAVSGDDAAFKTDLENILGAELLLSGGGLMNTAGGGTVVETPDASAFKNVTPGPVTVNSATLLGISGGAVDGTVTYPILDVGGTLYMPAAGTSADLSTAAGTVELIKNGIDASSSITLTVGANVDYTSITDDALFIADLEKSLNGDYVAPGGTAGSGGGGSSITSDAPFVFNAGSNVGSGYFSVDYTGEHLHIKDQFGVMIKSYPISEASLVDAANGSGEIAVGDLGILMVPAGYSGGQFSYQLTTTASTEFQGYVTVSANDGAREITIPNLTDQNTLWGTNTTLDRFKLMTDTTYQQEVKGMLDHGLAEVKAVIQELSNTQNLLASDKSGQNATLESLHNMSDTVSLADPIATAQAVFDAAQAQQRMMDALQTTAGLKAIEAGAAKQISKLAVQA